MVGVGLADVLGVGTEPGLDVLLEVSVLHRLGELAREHDPPSGRAGGVDGQVRALVLVEPAEPQDPVLLVPP